VIQSSKSPFNPHSLERCVNVLLHSSHVGPCSNFYSLLSKLAIGNEVAEANLLRANSFYATTSE